MGLRREPAGAGPADLLAFVVPGVEVVAVDQLEGHHLGVWEISPAISSSRAPVRLLPKSTTMWTGLASPAVAVAAADTDSTVGHPLQRLARRDPAGPSSATLKSLVSVAGSAEVADLRIAQVVSTARNSLLTCDWIDLPLDVGVDDRLLRFLVVPIFLFHFGLAAAALPAVADLGRGVAAARRSGTQTIWTPVLANSTCMNLFRYSV